MLGGASVYQSGLWDLGRFPFVYTASATDLSKQILESIYTSIFFGSERNRGAEHGLERYRLAIHTSACGNNVCELFFVNGGKPLRVRGPVVLVEQGLDEVAVRREW